MKSGLVLSIGEFFRYSIIENFEKTYNSPLKILTLIIDLILVGFIIYKIIKVAKETRAWQLLKGIILIMIITALSSLFKLRVLNYLITSFMTYGVVLIVIFQPELRRALEQLRYK